MPVMTKAQYEEWVRRVNPRNKIIKDKAPAKETPPVVEEVPAEVTPVAEETFKEQPKYAPKQSFGKKKSKKKSKK